MSLTWPHFGAFFEQWDHETLTCLDLGCYGDELHGTGKLKTDGLECEHRGLIVRPQVQYLRQLIIEGEPVRGRGATEGYQIKTLSTEIHVKGT